MGDVKATTMYQVQCFTNREAVKIPERIEKAGKRVHILTTSLDYSRTYLKESMTHALKKNENNPSFRIVLLTMDPECEATNGRAEQLGKNFKEFRDELRDALADMVDTFGHERQVDILQYRTLPTQSTYIIDNVAINSVVSLGIQSREGIHFVIENNPELLTAFNFHFGMLRSVSEQVNKRTYVSARQLPTSDAAFVADLEKIRSLIRMAEVSG